MLPLQTKSGGWFLKARCHAGLGQYDEARAAYSTCSAIRPDSPHPLAARGELEHKYLRDPEQAMVLAIPCNEHQTDRQPTGDTLLCAAGVFIAGCVVIDVAGHIDDLAADLLRFTRREFVFLAMFMTFMSDDWRCRE